MKIPKPIYNAQCYFCGRQFNASSHRATDYVKTKRKTEIWFNYDCYYKALNDVVDNIMIINKGDEKNGDN